LLFNVILLYDTAHEQAGCLNATLQKFYMNNLLQQTLGEIATQHSNSVPILEKYSLDFCCKGKRTLAKACEESAVDAAAVLHELENIPSAGNIMQMPFGEMTAEQLISHILIHHHYYVRQVIPQIESHLSKLFQKHKDNFEWIESGCEIFTKLKDELLQHMQKEEAVLFPRIKEIEKCYSANSGITATNDILEPIIVMESEHAEAGALLENLRTITNNYTPEQTACTTHRITLAELKEFEENLHQHVHLENNILFPKAIKMYNAMKAT
jgi:regulator of cell morphogenesis and NO signaling